jgi:hypothetical protein
MGLPGWIGVDRAFWMSLDSGKQLHHCDLFAHAGVLSTIA